MKNAIPRTSSKTSARAHPMHAAAGNGSAGLPDGQASDGVLADADARDAQIHRLAYERYLNNGCVDGHALDDWLAAEAAVGALGLGGDGAAADRQPGV